MKMKILKFKPYLLIALVIALGMLMWAQTQTTSSIQQSPLASGNVVVYTPTQLGMNAASLPGTGNTVSTPHIDMRQVKAWQISHNCTQSAALAVTAYAEDDSTTVMAETNLVNATGSGLNTVYGSVYSTTNASSALALVNSLRLPARSISFRFANGGAVAGTCTARVMLQY